MARTGYRDIQRTDAGREYDANDRPDLYQAIWNSVMDIPEFGRNAYDKFISQRFGDAVSQYFRQNSSALNGDFTDEDGRVLRVGEGFGDFLERAKASGSSFGYGDSAGLNRFAGIDPADLDAARSEYELDFAGSGISFDDLQDSALRNALQKNFGGRTSRFAERDFFSGNALSDYALNPENRDGGFLSKRFGQLRNRYGLR